MLLMLTSVPGDMLSLELGSDFRYVTGALLLISVIAIITFAYDASVQKTHGLCRELRSSWLLWQVTDTVFLVNQFQFCPSYINTCILIFEISGDFDNRFLKFVCEVVKVWGFDVVWKQLHLLIQTQNKGKLLSAKL